MMRYMVSRFTMRYLASETSNLTRNMSGGPPPGLLPPSYGAVYGITFLFSIIDIIGLIGNFLVIYVILGDRKMRQSVTNLFIINLALADFMIMLVGIPDIILFAIDKGWLLGLEMCKAQRFMICVCLYVSVMTLVSLCVERYIAIVYPIKANIFCSRSRILACIGCIWPLSMVMGLPTILYNVVRRPAPIAPEFCMFLFPGDHRLKKTIFKVTESVLFYFVPLIIQICLYAIISIRLFAGTEKLHRRQTVQENGVEKEKASDAIKARKGVVKMLIGCIVIYFVCYAPHAVKTIYDAVHEGSFHVTWYFQVASYALAYANSAANPLMYSVFSQNFRRKFRHALTCRRDSDGHKHRSMTLDSMGGSRATTRFTSLKQTNASDV